MRKRTITIGRSPKCDIVIPDENVSREHAELSAVGNRYVYKDISKNGASLNGQRIVNTAIEITPGAPILLSDRIPLPWAQIYAMLPIGSGGSVYEGETTVGGQGSYSNPDDTMAVGWGILAFLFPIIGWILYFAWKKDTPNKASSVATWAWIGFAVGFLLNFVSVLALM